jgi:geranylgeranyl reductase family protein
MDKKFDVAVIGAGPVGSYTAYRLAKMGFRVVLLEEHAVVGEPRHCTGVLGREAYDLFPELPKEAIQAHLSAAWIVSPSGERVRTNWFEGQAFVVHRTLFDQYLSNLAVEAGVELRRSSIVQSLHLNSQELRLQVQNGEPASHVVTAEMAVLASGVSYRLHPQIGLTPPAIYLHCAQSEVESNSIKEVEVYLGQEVAPGSFAWSVPIGENRVRVGVTAHRKASQYLEDLLSGPILRDRIKRTSAVIVKRPVPIRPIACSVAERVLLAGDAAGQVKPTTGGGIYYGLVGAELAAHMVQRAFAEKRFEKSFLMEYDRAWKRRLGREMWLGALGRRMFESMKDEKLNRLVRATRLQEVSRSVSKDAHFDWHAGKVLSFLMSPRVLWELI